MILAGHDRAMRYSGSQYNGSGVSSVRIVICLWSRGLGAVNLLCPARRAMSALLDDRWRLRQLGDHDLDDIAETW